MSTIYEIPCVKGFIRMCNDGRLRRLRSDTRLRAQPRRGSLSLQKTALHAFSCGAVLFYFSLLSKIRSLSSAWPTFSAKRSSRPSTVVWARSSPLMSSTI